MVDCRYECLTHLVIVVGALPIKVKLEMEVKEEHTSQVGTLHGGLISTLVNSATSLALMTTEKATPGVSVSLTISWNLLDLKEFVRRVRLKEYFGDDDIFEIYITDYVSSLQPKSTWTPPEDRNVYIDNFTKTARAHLDSFLSDHRHHDIHRNLTPSYYKAIGSLRRNTEIIIRPLIREDVSPFLIHRIMLLKLKTSLTTLGFIGKLRTFLPCLLFLAICLTLSDNILPVVQKLIPSDPKVGTSGTARLW
ncbi:Acyl-coenzyme A thioesterase 13 [Holothuria leucospilota]|uniref:Acyl-coenzyme A thioesterase 13 n=1 Tax=Holothuria leucospilota TaxID=206669 RepID=A0A9Q1BWG8_HOLLE|nr:Acyl-coenzyme A thioesterase 13 [Holothuria leucospilota]